MNIHSHEYDIPPIHTGNPDVQFTYRNADFGYFTIFPELDWYTAQLSCLDWGGNLATIQSTVEDNLLFYSITDFVSGYSCHIGLNDIQHDAGTDESGFVWVDGSNSRYRNFGTLGGNYPISIEDRYCVRARYRNTGILSQGWVNVECTTARGCFYCSKPGKYTIAMKGTNLRFFGYKYAINSNSTELLHSLTEICPNVHLLQTENKQHLNPKFCQIFCPFETK